MKGRFVLPAAPQRVTSRELTFTVGSVPYTSTLPAEALLSDKFDVMDGDLINGSLIDINRWGKSAPRWFTMQVVFPDDGMVPDQPGPVLLELMVE